jgi:hypothetical protein
MHFRGRTLITKVPFLKGDGHEKETAPVEKFMLVGCSPQRFMAALA